MLLDDVLEHRRSGLEVAIFPGPDWRPELQMVLRELLSLIEQAGCQVDIHSLGRFLGDFVPRLPLERAEEWQALALQRWLTQTKPELVERLANYFIDTGLSLHPLRSFTAFIAIYERIHRR